MNPFLPHFIALPIATAAVWVAAYWPSKPGVVSEEIMCPMPEQTP